MRGKYGWLAIHLFMGHLSARNHGNARGIRTQIVKLSNEKIRKYHLARESPASRQSPASPHRSPPLAAFTAVRDLSPPFHARSLSTLFILSSVPPVFSTMAGTTVEPSGGYQRWLPEMVPLVDW